MVFTNKLSEAHTFCDFEDSHDKCYINIIECLYNFMNQYKEYAICNQRKLICLQTLSKSNDFEAGKLSIQ